MSRLVNISSIFLILVCICQHAFADPYHDLDRSLNFSVEYLYDNDQKLSINDAIHANYIPTKKQQCFDLNSSTAWYKLSITNASDSISHIFLHINRGNLSKQLDLFNVKEKRVIEANHYDFFDENVGTKLVGSTIIYPLMIPSSESKTLYIRNESLAYQCIDLDIYDKDTTVQALINKNFYSNVIIVTLLTLAVSNLLLYSFFQKKEFIYYVLYLINAAVGLAYYYGVIFHHLQIYGENVYWLNLTAILNSVFLVLFVQSVIDTKKSYLTIHQLLNSVLFLSVADVLFAIFFDLSLAAQLVFIIFIYSFIVLAYMAIKLYQDKHPLINTFCLAYAAYILGMAVVVLMFMGILPLNEFTFHSSGIGIIIEALLFSYLLHYRVGLLRQQKSNAEDANTRKTRFLASASHDLRQPVHALELFSEALEDETLSSRGRVTLSYMKDCITSLNDLLTSLLDISRLDAGIVNPVYDHIDVFQLIQQLANNTQGQAKNKGLTIRTKGQSLWVNSDVCLLKNTLRNLLSNALKYTNKGGVLISCRARKNEVWVEVWDTGIGISDKEMAYVFDEFYQINHAERDRTQGLGLGLSIVIREMNILEHTFSLHSRKNQGTLARIKLKRVTPIASQISSKEIRNVNIVNRLVGKKILIIDDDEIILIATQNLVEKWNCEVATARNLKEATNICKQFIPDIIISDFRLKGYVTGIEVIEELRILLNTEVAAILITGDTSPDRLKQAQSSGLTLLHKPVQPAKLRAAINRAFFS